MSFFLLAGLLGVVIILAIVAFGRYAEQGVNQQIANQSIAALEQQLAEALEEQGRLNERVQNLEAIVTSEAWDDWQKQQRLAPDPLVPDEPPPADKAAQMARRLKT